MVTKRKILLAVASKNYSFLIALLEMWYEWAAMRRNKQTLYCLDACFEKCGYLNFDRVKEFLFSENVPEVAQD